MQWWHHVVVKSNLTIVKYYEGIGQLHTCSIRVSLTVDNNTGTSALSSEI